MSISSVGFETDDASAGDEVSQLQAAIDRTEVTLQRETRLGYLLELLIQLKISPDSQILVISKTSAQRKRISPPRRPIYFSDDVYVGYCVNGDMIETSVANGGSSAVAAGELDINLLIHTRHRGQSIWDIDICKLAPCCREPLGECSHYAVHEIVTKFWVSVTNCP